METTCTWKNGLYIATVLYNPTIIRVETTSKKSHISKNDIYGVIVICEWDIWRDKIFTQGIFIFWLFAMKQVLTSVEGHIHSAWCRRHFPIMVSTATYIVIKQYRHMCPLVSKKYYVRAPFLNNWWYITQLFIHYDDVIMSSRASQITSVSIVCSIVCSGADQRKHQSSASLAFVRGIHRWLVNSPHKGPVKRKMFPFDDVIIKFCLLPQLHGISPFHFSQEPWERLDSAITDYLIDYIGYSLQNV